MDLDAESLKKLRKLKENLQRSERRLSDTRSSTPSSALEDPIVEMHDLGKLAGRNIADHSYSFISPEHSDLKGKGVTPPVRRPITWRLIQAHHHKKPEEIKEYKDCSDELLRGIEQVVSVPQLINAPGDQRTLSKCYFYGCIADRMAASFRILGREERDKLGRKERDRIVSLIDKHIEEARRRSSDSEGKRDSSDPREFYRLWKDKVYENSDDDPRSIPSYYKPAELVRAVDTVIDGQDFLNQYERVLRKCPEDKGMPSNVVSLYMHLVVCRQFYDTLSGAYTEAEIERCYPIEGQFLLRGAMVKCEVVFPQYIFEAEDLNVFTIIKDQINELAQKKEVLFTTSNEFYMFLPMSQELVTDTDTGNQQELRSVIEQEIHRVGEIERFTRYGFHVKAEAAYDALFYLRSTPRDLYELYGNAVDQSRRQLRECTVEVDYDKSEPPIPPQRFFEYSFYPELKRTIRPGILQTDPIQLCEICQQHSSSLLRIRGKNRHICDQCQTVRNYYLLQYLEEMYQRFILPHIDTLTKNNRRIAEKIQGDLRSNPNAAIRSLRSLASQRFLGKGFPANVRRAFRDELRNINKFDRVQSWLEPSREQKLVWVKIQLDVDYLARLLEVIFFEYIRALAPEGIVAERREVESSIVRISKDVARSRQELEALRITVSKLNQGIPLEAAVRENLVFENLKRRVEGSGSARQRRKQQRELDRWLQGVQGPQVIGNKLSQITRQEAEVRERQNECLQLQLPDLGLNSKMEKMKLSILAEFIEEFQRFLSTFNQGCSQRYQAMLGRVRPEWLQVTDDCFILRAGGYRQIIPILEVYHELMESQFPRFLDDRERCNSPIRLVVSCSSSKYPFFKHWVVVREAEVQFKRVGEEAPDRGPFDIHINLTGSGIAYARLAKFGALLNLIGRPHSSSALHRLAEIARYSEELAKVMMKVYDKAAPTADRDIETLFGGFSDPVVELGIDGYRSLLTLSKVFGEER